MRIGLPGDPRKFRGHGGAEATKNSHKPKTRWDRCQVCGMIIKGKKWRVGEGKYVCFRCHNESRE